MVTLLLSTLVVFVGVRALPGDPALALAGEEADPATVQPRSAPTSASTSRCSCSTSSSSASVLHGDLGTSIATGLPVTDLIATTLPVTLWLSLYAL